MNRVLGGAATTGGESRLTSLARKISTRMRGGWSGRTVDQPLGYDDESSARTGIAIVRHATQVSYERLVTLFQHVAYLERNQVDGALVECGVWKGGASAQMAYANLVTAPSRRQLHLFDSFEGMPEPDSALDGPDAVDWGGKRGDGTLRPTGVNTATVDEALEVICGAVGYPRDAVHIHKGWFQETIPAARGTVGAIALLRVDGDWYSSTKAVLQGLYPQVSEGGIVVIDDYGHFPGCRMATDEFIAALPQPIYLHHIDYTGRYFLKPAG
jgi:hypothetical protein